jgi:acyl-CoA synthetase (AMP-forming)/AMP-acid ligase II
MIVRDFLERAAKECGNKTAVIHDSTRLTYADLLNRTAALADFFSQRGVVKGSRIVTYLPNVPEFVDAYLAAL